MFSQFSIRTKLIALVSLLLIAPISLGAFAIFEMRAINASAQDIQTTWLPSIRQVSELRVQAARYRAILRDHILITDEKGKASTNKALDARVKAYDLAISKYEPLISSRRRAGAFREAGNAWKDFRDAADEVIAASGKRRFRQGRGDQHQQGHVAGPGDGCCAVQTGRAE